MDLSSKSISIVGCGWLGRPLGGLLVKNGHTVWGSCTQEAKQDELIKNGIKPFVFHSSQEIKAHLFWQSQVIIITLPFKRGLENPYTYYQDIQKILSMLTHRPYLIFTSSTAVYPSHNRVWHEEDDIPSISLRYDTLRSVEKMILAQFPSAVLRLGGLYGPKRDPKDFVKKIFDEEERVNLISQSHAVILIQRILEKKLTGIYNVVDSAHPKKKEFYSALGIPIQTKPGGNHKIISNQKLLNALNIHDSFFNDTMKHKGI